MENQNDINEMQETDSPEDADVLEKVNALFVKSGLTQKQLSELTNASPATISRTLNNGKSPNFFVMCAIIKACGGSVDEIIGIKRKTESVDPSIIQLYQQLLNDTKMSYEREITEMKLSHEKEISEKNEKYAELQIMHKETKRSDRVKFIVILCIFALVAFVLVYDITHPNMGYVRYTAEVISGALNAITELFTL